MMLQKLKNVKSFANAKFDETVEMAFVQVVEDTQTSRG